MKENDSGTLNGGFARDHETCDRRKGSTEGKTQKTDDWTKTSAYLNDGEVTLGFANEWEDIWLMRGFLSGCSSIERKAMTSWTCWQ